MSILKNLKYCIEMAVLDAQIKKNKFLIKYYKGETKLNGLKQKIKDAFKDCKKLYNPYF